MSNFVQVVQKWRGTNKFVRTKSHTGSKFSKMSLRFYARDGLQLCTYIAVFLSDVRCRLSRASNSEPHFLVNFFTSLRKDSVANYASIWTVFSPADRRTGFALQRTKRFVVMSECGATRFANCGRNFSKRKKIGRRVVPNTLYGYY